MSRTFKAASIYFSGKHTSNIRCSDGCEEGRLVGSADGLVVAANGQVKRMNNVSVE